MRLLIECGFHKRLYGIRKSTHNALAPRVLKVLSIVLKWENRPHTVDCIWDTLTFFACCMATRLRKKLRIELSSRFEVFIFKFSPKFRSKVSCFSLSATCHGSHRDAEAALEDLDFLDDNEQLDGAWLISDNNGSVISLSSHGVLEISDTEGENARSKIERLIILEVLGGERTRDDGDYQVCVRGGSRGGRDGGGV